jgi:hypothetical protein
MKEFTAAKRHIDVSVGESVRILRELQELSQNELADITEPRRGEGNHAPATKQKGRAPKGSGFLFSRAGYGPARKQV